jgi:TamB, inner membrane protein subunit of TAM complex
VRRWVVRPFVWVLLLVLTLAAANVLFLDSRFARESAADLLRGELSDALSREVALGAVDFHLWTFTPSFEVRDLTIPGPARGDPAVLRLPMGRLSLSWRALSERRLEIQQLDLDRPQLYLRFNPDGTNNLPRLRPRPANQPRRVELAIDRLLVQNGTFQLNERRARLDLQARALWARLTDAGLAAKLAARAAAAGAALPRAARGAAPAPGPGAGARPAAGGAPSPPGGARPAAAGAVPGAGGGLLLDFLVAAQDVVLRLPDARPYPLALSASGRLDSDRLRIAAARLSGPDLALRVEGAIGWRGENEVDLGVTAQMAAGWLNRVGYLQEPIDGAAAIDGRFTFRHESWEYSGQLRAPRIVVLRRDFRDLAADFRGGRQRLAVDVRRALYAGGELSGPVLVETGADPGPRGTGRPVELDLAIRGLAVQPFLADLFPRQFAGPGPPVVQLASRASGQLRYRFQSSQWRLGTGRAELAVAAAPAGTAGARGLPLAGGLPLRLAGGALTADSVVITAPGQEATVTGFSFDLRRDSGRLDYRLVSRDAGALAPLFPPGKPRLPTAHWTGPPETTPIWLPNAGHGTAAGAVTITPGGYSARFDLDLQGVVSHSLGSADRLRGTLTLEPLAVENLRLEATAGAGALILSGRIPLARAGRAVPDQPLALAVDAAQWPAAGLVPYLPAWFPVAGLAGGVSGRLDLGGDFDHLTGRADADVQDLAVAGFAVGRARGQLSWNPARFAVDGAAIENRAGRLALRASYDRHSDAIALDLDGPALDLAAPPLSGFLRAPGLAGSVALTAAVGGTLERPRAHVSLRGHDVSWGGRVLDGAPPGAAQVTVDWDGEQLRASGAVGNLLAWNGGGRLDRRQAALRFDLRSANLGGVSRLAAAPVVPVAAGAPAPAGPVGGPAAGAPVAAGPVAGPAAGASVPAGPAARPAAIVPPASTPPPPAPVAPASPGAPTDPNELGGTLAGTFALDANFVTGGYRGQLRLDELRLAYAGRQIANREPVVVDLSPRGFELRSFDLGETGTGLTFVASGRVGLAGSMPLDLRVQSTISAVWAKPFLPGLDPAGEVDLLAAIKGTVAAPAVSGQAVLHDARVIIAGLASSVEGIEGTLSFNSDRVLLEGLSGRLGGGTVRATGQLTLPAAGRPLSYRVELAAQGVSLRYPAGWVSRGDAALSLVGTGAGRQIQGLVQLDRMLYAEDLQVDLAQMLLRGLQRERVHVAPTNDLFAKTQLNLSIQGAGALRVTDNVADLRGDVELTVVGTLASPVLFGSVQLESGGTLKYSDNKYQVDRGSLTFANPNRIDPVVDLVLKTEVQSYTISLNLSGTLERLNAKFSSNAELADIDIISLLASGQRPTLGAPPPPVAGEAAGQAAASSFLAGQAASAVSSRVGRLFGLDRFRVDTQTLTQAGQPTSGVVITAGKRLSKTVFVTYVSNPSSPRLDVRQVEWQVAKNLTLLLTQSGRSYAVDVQRETRF